MRRALDLLYRTCGGLAAMFLAAIAILILTQVVARLIGFFVPAASDFAGFCLAASSFLALAYTFRAGSHIRVTLVLQRVPRGGRRYFDLAALAVGAALVSYFAWQTVLLARESFHYNDLSEGLVPVPLWIPQSGMALGIIVLAIALLDDLVTVLRGGTAAYEHNADALLAQVKDDGVEDDGAEEGGG
jgi:TRAP-type C4-dicarboxylate transport system permease small subunit